MGANGKPTRDPKRDAQYTRELGDAICAAFKRNTVVMPTHVVATAAFAELQKTLAHTDLFALLSDKDSVRVPRERMESAVATLLEKLHAAEARSELVLAPSLHLARPAKVLSDALTAFAGYHTHPVLVAGATDLVLGDTRLIFYYQNRLAAHGFAYDALAPKTKAA